MRLGVVILGVQAVALAGSGAAVAQQDCAAAMAPIVVQIANVEVGPQGDNLICEIQGQVVQSFAGPFQPGQVIRTTIPCSGPIEAGMGAVLLDPDNLEAAGVVEMHFGMDGFVREFGYGELAVFALDGPTAVPQQIAGNCTFVGEDGMRVAVP
jgi:hypothetical protein